MSYLNEFHKRIESKDFMGLLQLWEEYCTCDEVDGIELKKILDLIYCSDYCDSFGNYAESILPLWKSVDQPAVADQVFERILDIQTTGSPVLAELAYEFLKTRYGKDTHFNEKIRQIGLRNKSNFRRAIRNYRLLNHMQRGCFVYHTAGWGTGEVLSISLIREELTIEFENVLGEKHVSFENAFKTLDPLEKDHFLAMRFGRPDELEQMAKQDPLRIIRKLLTDIGAKSASEIKDEMCELVIPKGEWTSWWQLARAKLKKDPGIETPSSLSGPFRIREQDISPHERFLNALKLSKTTDDRIITCYNFIRDYSEQLRQPSSMETLESTLDDLRSSGNLNQGQLFEVLCLSLETRAKDTCEKQLNGLVDKLENPAILLAQIPIVALQKKLLIHVHARKPHWSALFAQLLLVVDQVLLREYLFKELLLQARSVLDAQFEQIIEHANKYPEFLFWYLQKAMQDNELPYSSRDGIWRLSEAFLTALHAIESDASYVYLVKKMTILLTAKRFSVTRQIMEDADIDFLQEFLLLASKCQSFSQQDNKILASLACVACPDLKNILHEDEKNLMERVIWTTEQGLLKIQSRIEHLSTTEMLDNAKEIETARAHGDLRENSEYKFALERRSRIQGEIRSLSRQLNHAKIISKNDLDTSVVSVGTKVSLKTNEGQILAYTILGPWDADTENNIISFQSKLAMSLLNKKVGDSLNIHGIICKLCNIESVL